jgi:hypothetical protein
MRCSKTEEGDFTVFDRAIRAGMRAKQSDLRSEFVRQVAWNIQ